MARDSSLYTNVHSKYRFTIGGERKIAREAEFSLAAGQKSGQFVVWKAQTTNNKRRTANNSNNWNISNVSNNSNDAFEA